MIDLISPQQISETLANASKQSPKVIVDHRVLQNRLATSEARQSISHQSSTQPVTTSGGVRNIGMRSIEDIHSVEFHGASSSLALIRHMENLSEDGPDDSTEYTISTLLRVADRGVEVSANDHDESSDRHYFRAARKFLDAYLCGIHHVQPIFEQDDFLARCEDLWFDRVGQQPRSFLALYFATLSLGSLVSPQYHFPLAGEDRLTWSRKLYQEAMHILDSLGDHTNVETVQCWYVIVSYNVCH